MEVWKDININGYKGFYQISNLASVKSLQRTIPIGGNSVRVKKEAIMRQRVHTHGYLYVSLRANCNERKFFIHKLMALAFIPNPYNKRCVNHINGIKQDNRLENLEWATHSENNTHAYRTGLKPSRAGRPTAMFKLDEQQVYEIRDLLKTYHQADVAQMFGVSRSCIQHINDRRTWTHI